MSNESLVARIESSISHVRAGDITAKELMYSLRNNGRALEAMPYALIEEMESLALNLEIAAWAEEDGFVPDLASVLTQLEVWLEKVPTRP